MALSDLFRPKWKHSDPDVRMAAIAGVADPETLKAIALNDSDRDVRLTAVKRLSDPAVLADVAGTDDDPEVRVAAVDRLSDELLLTHVAKGDKFPAVRCAAAKKLSDQKILSYLAEEDSDEQVRQCAIERVTDQNVLTQIAKSDRSAALRLAAAGRVTDCARLSEIVEAACAPEFEAVRNRAARKLREVIDDLSDLEQLFEFLSEDYERTRHLRHNAPSVAAAKRLGELGQPRALKPLAAAAVCRSPKHDILPDAAASAMVRIVESGKCSPAELVDALVSYWESHAQHGEGEGAPGEKASRALESGLKRHGDSALQHLAAAMARARGDTSAGARLRSAVKAIGGPAASKLLADDDASG